MTCTRYWQISRSSRRQHSVTGLPVASEKKAASAVQTQGALRVAPPSGQL
ncbi:hypothetical protein [Burkholderia gladioli]|nr:hypothetical protein [Burkholderia gladioli]MDN7749437.1 hypothetical protein [Burkholderia gladioli]